MISVFRCNSVQHKVAWTDLGEVKPPGPDETLWIDLDNPTPEEEKQVFQTFFPIHPLTLEDITRLRREPNAPPHFPKVEEFPDYLFVIVNPLLPGLLQRLQDHLATPGSPEPRLVTQLSALITERMLITHHYDKLVSVEQLRSYVDRHENQASRGPDYLFHLILDTMVDDYAGILDHLDETLDRTEEEIFNQPTRRLLMELVHLKRVIITLRKTLIYEREVLARLCRGEFSLIDDREMVYYRNVYDHLIRFTELIESSREMVSDLMQTHLSSASHKLNEVMKALTMISTIVLPMTLVAGIYGMNFEQNIHPSFKDSPYGFYIALGLMGMVGGGSYLWLRWKQWV